MRIRGVKNDASTLPAATGIQPAAKPCTCCCAALINRISFHLEALAALPSYAVCIITVSLRIAMPETTLCQKKYPNQSRKSGYENHQFYVQRFSTRTSSVVSSSRSQGTDIGGLQEYDSMRARSDRLGIDGSSLKLRCEARCNVDRKTTFHATCVTGSSACYTRAGGKRAWVIEGGDQLIARV